MTTQTETQSPKIRVHPVVDVFENEAEFLLVADLPGVGKSGLELNVEAGELRLRAQTDDLEYQRSFKLGDDLDVEAIDAKLELGQLEIRLPKTAKRMHKIAVK